MPEQNIARLDHQAREGKNYLSMIEKLTQAGLIASSPEKDLTASGKRVVQASFGDTLEIRRIVGIVERVRQVGPDWSELDAFVAEASEVVYILNDEDKRREEIGAQEREMATPKNGTYYLAGIHVLNEAIKAGLLVVNPRGSPGDQSYIGYNRSVLY